MPPATNPYGDRKPVTVPAQFCVRTNDLAFLAEKISCGHTCAISGEPLMGKTSLLHYLAHPQGARALPDFAHSLGDPDAYVFVLIEPGRLPIYSSQSVSRYLYDLLIEEMEKTHVLPPKHRYIQIDANEYEVQRAFEGCIRDSQKRVVVLFDDFDIVLKKFTKDDAAKTMQLLHAAIQAFDLDSRLNCIFFSEDPFEQLLKSAGFTSASPLSRIISDYLSLQPLNDTEIDQYIHKPLQDARFPRSESEFIKQLAGKHLGLLKIVCFHLFEARFRKKQPATLHTLQETMQKDPGMLWLLDTLWQRVEQAEIQEELPLKNAMVRLARGNRLETRDDLLLLEHLQRRGLIDCTTQNPWILGDIFSDFIQRQEAETRFSFLREKNAPHHITQQNMTPQEAKLYHYLAEHSEHTCTRTELQIAIWGDKPPASQDALEQLIRRVRDKIEPHPTSPEHLLTVRGLGYLLRDRKKLV
jgi:hypothetical protein